MLEVQIEVFVSWEALRNLGVVKMVSELKR